MDPGFRGIPSHGNNKLSSLTTFTGPPILMGDDIPMEVTRQGRVEIQHGSFKNLFHVSKLSMNLLFVYRITHTSTRKRVEFPLDSMTIYMTCMTTSILLLVR
jgi:hypothetical protein